MDLPAGVAMQREAEMAAGRALFEGRNKGSSADTKRALAAHDEQIREDEERVKALNATPTGADRAALDRAGAELIDQSQTMLEAAGHDYDRREKVLTNEQQTEIETLEGITDAKRARELATDAVTAQAVNQPTVLASEMGVDTEDRPLNVSGFEDRVLATGQEIPEDRHVPKTRRKAEAVSRGKVPTAEDIVRAAFEPEALRIASKAPSDVLAP